MPVQYFLNKKKLFTIQSEPPLTLKSSLTSKEMNDSLVKAKGPPLKF